MKEATKILGCAVFVLSLLAFPAQAAVLSEDFEGAGYVIGNDPTAVPGLNWLKRIATQDRLTEGTYGTDATIKVVDGVAVTGGGTKSIEIRDYSDAPNPTGFAFDVVLTSDALLNYNGGNGIQKGTVQLDVTYGTLGYSEINLFDDYDATTLSVVQNNAASHVRLNTTGLLQTRPPNINAATAITLGTTYRFLFTFDNTTSPKSLNYNIKEGPSFATDFHNHTTTFYSTDAAFKGVRGIHFYTGTTALQTLTIDNLVFTDTDTPPPASAQTWEMWRME